MTVESSHGGIGIVAAARPAPIPLEIPAMPLQSKQLLRMRLYAGMVLLDGVAIGAAFAAANLLRFGDMAAKSGIELLALVWPVYLAIAVSNGAYGLQALKEPRQGIRRALLALLVAAAILIGCFFYLKVSIAFSRQVFAVGLVMSVVLIANGRRLYVGAIALFTDGRLSNEVLLVDGAPIRPSAGELVIIADGGHSAGSDPLALDRIGTFLRHVDRVIVAARADRRASWVAALKGVGIDVEVLAPELDLLGVADLRRYDGQSTLLVGSKPLGMAASLQKRALDVAVSSAALLMLAPLLLGIAVAVKLDGGGGPIFFRQARVGEGNRIFRIFKFRTMRDERQDPNGDCSVGREDDRVTRIGAVLRRTSLDELPQLFNVLLGDMSIVGPRPHALGSKAEEALFWEIDGRYWERHGIKPGITGLAQVRGFRGATATRADVRNRLQSDLEYLVGWSIWRDLAIMFRTVRVLSHPNAF